MDLSLSEKLRKEAGRLREAVDHSEFWRDSGYEPESGTHRESELKQISENIMTSEMMSKALQKDRNNYGEFSAARKDNIEIIRREHEEAKARSQAKTLRKSIEEKVNGKGGVKKKWLKARRENDFSIVEKDFIELVDLYREYAQKIKELERKDCENYEIIFQQYEPHLKVSEVEEIFSELEDEIKDIIEEVERPEEGKKPASFDQLSEVTENSEELHEEIVFDLLSGDRSNILVKEGPYGMERGDALSSGMNVNSDQPWPKAIGTTVHEFGHVDYRSNLPVEFAFTPLGEPASDTIDEACARLWQTHVSQRKFFWNHVKEIAEDYGLDFDFEKVHREVNRLKLENQSRINADDLTYHLHIIALFRIERKLINGEADVEELENLWNREMDKALPEYSSDVPVSEKFLQDPHWGKGKFGYYPTYSLGQIAATQIFRAAEKHITNLEKKMEEGDYKVLSEWLHDNLYQHGRRYKTQELIRRASGTELSPEPFLKYAREKFLS